MIYMTRKEVSNSLIPFYYVRNCHNKAFLRYFSFLIVFLHLFLDLKRQYQTLTEVQDGRNNHSSDTTSDISGHVQGSNDGNVPGSAFHIGPNEDMGQVRLGQQGNYHVTNTTNKEW